MTAPTAAPSPAATITTAAHIWFLLDRSGSMQPLAAAVVDGFNGFLLEQQNMVEATAAPARLTLAQFDGADPYEVLIDRARIDRVAPLRHAQFQPRGSTPLYDAIATLIERADARVATRAARGKAPESQLIVIFTDGDENASRTWTQPSIFERIENRKAQGWTFVFLGANQDSYANGAGLAMAAGSVSNYAPSPAGMQTAWRSVSRSVSAYRAQSAPERAAATDDFFGGTKEAEQG